VITLGLTTVTLQAGYRVGLMMLDNQMWCEAHNKMCHRFMFGCVLDTGLGMEFLELKPPSGGII
jgi:hypothetical protein